MNTAPKPTSRQRPTLRSRLLVIMLSVVLTATLLCTLVFGLTLARNIRTSRELQQNLTDNVHLMVEMLLYQQETYIKSIYTHQQSIFINDHLATLREQGEQPDWDRLLADAYELINDAERYGGVGTLDSEGATQFISMDGEMYFRWSPIVDGQDLITSIERVYREATEADFFSDLAEYPSNSVYTRGEKGMILAWRPLGEGDGRIGLFVPAAATDASGALRQLMEEEAALAARESSQAVWWAVIVLLVFLAVLIVALTLLSRKLSYAFAAPVENELQRNAEEKEMLERVARLKDEFLGNVSHELKTPLTVISGYAQESGKTLAALPEAEESRRAMTVIVSEADRLALMVSQILDVTRIDEGRMTLELQPVFLPELLQSTLQTYYPEFTKNNNLLEIARGGDSPTVMCDRERITQVLVNLISNAARHTHDGKITVGIRETGGFAEISVTDTGEGIPSQLLPQLFERYKTNKARDGRNTGTGLGLYICRHIVTAHGGEIGIESTPGVGTTVRFTLGLKS